MRKMVPILLFEIKSNIEVKPKHRYSQEVASANKCKDTVVSVKNQNKECLPVGFTFPLEMLSTESSNELPVTTRTIMEQ